MEMLSSFIVLADISGYTHFTKMHKLSLLHAEYIITELLERIIDGAENPLALMEIEGDCAYFSAVSDNSPQMAQDIFGQAERLFDVFNERERELIRCAT